MMERESLHSSPSSEWVESFPALECPRCGTGVDIRPWLREAAGSQDAGRVQEGVTLDSGREHPSPAPQYRTIVADPPWQYPGGFNGFGKRRALPYEAMTVDEIASLPVPSILAREGYLFMWATNKHLPLAYELVGRWGFSYRQTLTWDKGEGSGGLGGMFATTSEFVVISQNISPGTNAHGSRTNRVRHPESVLRYPRQPRHSKKPDSFLDLVETVAPGPYLEMFARSKRLGWHVWGNEVDSDVEIAA